jgi:hypothetical protein
MNEAAMIEITDLHAGQTHVRGVSSVKGRSQRAARPGRRQEHAPADDQRPGDVRRGADRIDDLELTPLVRQGQIHQIRRRVGMAFSSSTCSRT